MLFSLLLLLLLLLGLGRDLEPLHGMRLPHMTVEAVAVLEDLVAQLAVDGLLHAVEGLEVPPVDPADHERVADRALNAMVAAAAGDGSRRGGRGRGGGGGRGGGWALRLRAVRGCKGSHLNNVVIYFNPR